MEQHEGRNLFDFDVIDSSGRKVGSVDNVLLDTATGRPEFIGVKTGWIFGRTHIVPVERARIDETGRRIEVPYAESEVRNAPDVPAEGTLQADEEERIYSHYGIERSRERSPTGLPGAGAATATGTDLREGEEARMTLSEEELRVGKHEVEDQGVRLRKVVRTEHVEEPVELRREEIQIDRVPAAGRSDVPPDAFQEREVDMRATREEPVVEKEARVTGEVRAYKTEETERRNVQGEVRREEVETDADRTRGGTGRRESNR